MKGYYYFLLLFLLFLPLFSITLHAYSIQPISLTTFHGKLFAATRCAIYELCNGSWVKLLQINNVEQIEGGREGIYINNGSSIYYYNFSSLIPVNVTNAFKMFYDNYTGELYVTGNSHLYIINCSEVVSSYYIPLSFCYVTFNCKEAIVDSQCGYFIFFYNGSEHLTISCQDAFAGMIFADGKFITGSFDPRGLFIYNNLSVLYINKIWDIYLRQLPQYNITLVDTEVTPNCMIYFKGMLYISSCQGIQVMNLENYQTVYYNPCPAYSMVVYNCSVLVATKSGIISLDLTPLPLYTLTINKVGGLYGKVIINGTEYTFCKYLSLRLEEGVYNLTFLNCSIYKPCVRSEIVKLYCNKTVTIKYVGIPEELSIVLKGLSNGSKYTIIVNNQTYHEDTNVVNFTLPAGNYCIKINVNGVTRTFIVNLILDERLVVNVPSTFSLTTTSITSFSSTHPTNSLSAPCYIGIALVIVAIAFIIIVILRRR
ncbi:hypothetical protein [Acidianus sp. HS-5]|uniref:hypothetical protein n=1 Tax=Acidianus sp. HS-5 TaxID=2886040 RepID=UPI001F25926B|nr:hypothetical protein [Acidianus sp. HS-5]BDC17754.1 hypothetical protein HS5_06440 [Acidianus sp. HS-5]